MLSISLKTFNRICHTARPILTISCLILFGWGLYQALIVSPIDYQQKDAVRIMYVHVPAAWMALGIYCMMAILNVIGFVWKHPLSFILSISAAPIGACFAFLCLITGSIWGKPMWGTWWVFDARLTSMLILFFFYIGYILLYQSHTDKMKGEKAAGILSIVGVINVPIVKFSVEWWHTLHQPASIIRSGGIAIAPEMLKPLLLMATAYSLFFIYVLILRSQSEIYARKIERNRLAKL